MERDIVFNETRGVEKISHFFTVESRIHCPAITCASSRLAARTYRQGRRDAHRYSAVARSFVWGTDCQRRQATDIDGLVTSSSDCLLGQGELLIKYRPYFTWAVCPPIESNVSFPFSAPIDSSDYSRMTSEPSYNGTPLSQLFADEKQGWSG